MGKEPTPHTPACTSLLLVFRMRWRSWLNSDKLFGGKIHAICIGHGAGRDESVEAGQRHLRRTHQHAEGQGWRSRQGAVAKNIKRDFFSVSRY